MKPVLLVFLSHLTACAVNAAFTDYIKDIGNYLGFNKNEPGDSTEDVYNRKIPYEVSTVDERFLSEAAKLTGVALSELDSCQHRVVLKLNTDCDKMNDEYLAKMAVHLLNCQSFVEGRPTFPCTDEMSIKDCTKNMDPDTWTSYHLMSNRVRAVCYSVRQAQFRGLAELTVNKLMEAARDQLKTLGKVSDGQEKLRSLAEVTLGALTEGHDALTRQQRDLLRAQFHGQLEIEDNIRKLGDEKRLILETHNQLTEMTQVVQDKLEYSLRQLGDQSEESRANHRELIEDLLLIQSKAKDIFDKIDESSELLMKQNEEFRKLYRSTLKSLYEVNETVHNLEKLVGGTRQALEDRLAWIHALLGGTDLAIERIYLILWHVMLMLVAMLTCSFLSARAGTRLIVATLPPVNLAVALYREREHLDFVTLVGTMGILISGQILAFAALKWRKPAVAAMPWIKEKLTPAKQEWSQSAVKENGSVTSTSYHEIAQNDTFQSRFKLDKEDLDETTDSFRDLTPPVSRNGYYNITSRSKSRSSTPLRLNSSVRNSCTARTRAGTPCKLSALHGRDYCYRHQTGESVMG